MRLRSEYVEMMTLIDGSRPKDHVSEIDTVDFYGAKHENTATLFPRSYNCEFFTQPAVGAKFFVQDLYMYYAKFTHYPDTFDRGKMYSKEVDWDYNIDDIIMLHRIYCKPRLNFLNIDGSYKEDNFFSRCLLGKFLSQVEDGQLIIETNTGFPQGKYTINLKLLKFEVQGFNFNWDADEFLSKNLTTSEFYHVGSNLIRPYPIGHAYLFTESTKASVVEERSINVLVCKNSDSSRKKRQKNHTDEKPVVEDLKDKTNDQFDLEI